MVVVPEEELEEERTLRPEVLGELVEAGWFHNSVPDWTGADCASHPDPDLWHRRKAVDQFQAIAICKDCPIRDMCREWGESNETDGVWGGIALRPVVSTVMDPTAECPQGHVNWYYFTNANGTLRRRCRDCQRLRESAKRKELAA